MTQSIVVPKGYSATIPLRFMDGVGRHHAPLTGGEVWSSNEDVVTAKLNDEGEIEVKGLAQGQAVLSVAFRAGDNDELAITEQLGVIVSEERQEAEVPDESPDRMQFDRPRFEGKPKPADHQKLRERKEHRARVQHEVNATNESAAKQDEQRRHTDQGEKPEETALRERGPVTPQNPSGAELAQRLPAEASGHAGTLGGGEGSRGAYARERELASADHQRERHAGNASGAGQPERHNPGNQGGGDQTGGGRTTAHTQTQPGGDARGKDDEIKTSHGQQRGGASSPGTPASAPGSKRG